MLLTSATISKAKPNDTSYKLSDGRGLYLAVSPSGGKWWRFRYRFGGKQNTLSCGVFPQVNLDEARRRRDEFLALPANGENPSEHVKAERAATLPSPAATSAATAS